ncbi:Hypothetical predicted protein, partial [Marmota monax]
KSTEQMKKVPTIILSVSYKGVKFIDATNKNIIAEHEIRNISCAAQDPEDLSTFAYITKDLKSNHHYCHVFTAFDVNLAYEIILTLGQAFEVAYQLALQARKGGHSSTLPESFENKPSKPIPKPRVSIRKSVDLLPEPGDSRENSTSSVPHNSSKREGTGCPAAVHGEDYLKRDLQRLTVRLPLVPSRRKLDARASSFEKCRSWSWAPSLQQLRLPAVRQLLRRLCRHPVPAGSHDFIAVSSGSSNTPKLEGSQQPPICFLLRLPSCILRTPDLYGGGPQNALPSHP